MKDNYLNPKPMKKQSLFIAFVVVLTTIACKKTEESNLPDGLYAEFETNYGDFTAELNYKKAPLTVSSFVSLAEGTSTAVDEKYKGIKYFDGLKFHRVVEGFVIQGGDPEGTGGGGPGYEFPNETDTGLNHGSKGILSMANAGPDTNGSQFFVTLNQTPSLDGGYSVFGKVIEGQEIVDSIGQVEVGQRDVPVKDVIMNHVKIVRVGDDAKAFDAPKVFNDKMAANIAEQEASKEKIEKELNELGEGFTKTSSGLRYKITDKVEGAEKPVRGQTVAVYYKGMLPDGKVFDKRLEEEGQDPLSFSVGEGRVIPGWDEGLQLLGKGESARLIIPPHLAYGDRGAGKMIPPNAILIFDVTLSSID